MNESEQVLHPYKTGPIIDVHIVICIFMLSDIRLHLEVSNAKDYGRWYQWSICHTLHTDPFHHAKGKYSHMQTTTQVTISCTDILHNVSNLKQHSR
jgi:hypothetical protein